MRSAHVILRRACPTWGARLEGLRASRRTATSETEPAAILRDGAPQVGRSRLAYLMCRSRVNPRSVRLLRMRSVSLCSIRPIRSVSWNRSTRTTAICDRSDDGSRAIIKILASHSCLRWSARMVCVSRMRCSTLRPCCIAPGHMRLMPLLSRPCNAVNYRAGTGTHCKQQERNRLPVKGEIYREPSSSI